MIAMCRSIRRAAVTAGAAILSCLAVPAFAQTPAADVRRRPPRPQQTDPQQIRDEARSAAKGVRGHSRLVRRTARRARGEARHASAEPAAPVPPVAPLPETAPTVVVAVQPQPPRRREGLRCRRVRRAPVDRRERCRSTAAPRPRRRCSTRTWPSSGTSSARLARTPSNQRHRSRCTRRRSPSRPSSIRTRAPTCSCRHHRTVSRSRKAFSR